MSTRVGVEMEKNNQVKTREQWEIRRAKEKARRAEESQVRATRVVEMVMRAFRRAKAIQRNEMVDLRPDFEEYDDPREEDSKDKFCLMNPAFSQEESQPALGEIAKAGHKEAGGL